MKKKLSILLAILLCVLTAFGSLAGCTYTESTVPPDTDKEIPDDGGDGPDTPDVPVDPEDGTFAVQLTYNGKNFVSRDKDLRVVWDDGYNVASAPVKFNGSASIEGLDGEYHVRLSGLDAKYIYNPNDTDYVMSNDKRSLEIEVYDVSYPSNAGGSKIDGSNYYERAYTIRDVGMYRAAVEDESDIVYYRFKPRTNGTFSIQSIVSIYDDLVNPGVNVHGGTEQNVVNPPEKIEKGGAELVGGFTRNFYWEIKITDAGLGNVFTFGIRALSKNGSYPVTVDFVIGRDGDYSEPSYPETPVEAKEVPTEKPSGSRYNWVDASESDSKDGVADVLDSDKYRYWAKGADGGEGDGYWHRYDETRWADTHGYGPRLCAFVAQPCNYLELSFPHVEDPGNNALTITSADGTVRDDYEDFIRQYEAACDSEKGVCYVTMELKIFLQRFAIAGGYFMDGNGFIEQGGYVAEGDTRHDPLYATEEDQWLFACGYYADSNV